MTIATQKITPCLWFDTEAEDAANFYVSIFKESRIRGVNRYGNEGRDVHGKPAGSVMTVEFELEGQRFVGLNGGPQFKFDEAVSFQLAGRQRLLSDSAKFVPTARPVRQVPRCVIIGGAAVSWLMHENVDLGQMINSDCRHLRGTSVSQAT